MGYPSRLLTDTLLGRFVVHPSRKKAITLPLVPFSWGKSFSCLSAQTVIRYDIVNCIIADEHMLGYACRVENANDCLQLLHIWLLLFFFFFLRMRMRLKDSWPAVAQRHLPLEGNCRPRTDIFLPELMAVVFSVLGSAMSDAFEVKRYACSWKIHVSKTLEVSG